MNGEIGLPLALVLISVALRVGWCGLSQNLGWQTRASESGDTLPMNPHLLGRHRLSQSIRGVLTEASWPEAMARFLYFVGLPYLGLISGVLTTKSLGLKGLDYFALASAAGSFQQAGTLLLLEWLLDSQVLIPLSLLALLFLSGIRWHLSHNHIRLALPQVSMLAVIYTGLHWAFYRAAFWTITGDLYLGLVWGIGLVTGEWLLIGWIQKQLLPQSSHLLTQFMVLTLTGLLFFYVPNLWLIWPVHLLMLVVLNQQPGHQLDQQTS